ncbi:zinc ribbon domain-containing protein [Paenibacillus sp. P22]|uniref:zinc ribbon domain-containing protein n=1 Tax=Paenibacillus sp. P22 TaxID=483908 RepID=UPI0022B74EA5|nr:zinc ribbon domain-containing protein [Paenibacillus sp. P22]
MLKCPSCGSGMVPAHVTRKRKDGTSKVNHYYVCSRYNSGGRAFAGRLNDLNKELDAELTRRSKLQLELRDNQAEPVSYEIVRSLMDRFDALLRHSPLPQRKTLLHLIVKRITLDKRKRVGSVELAFNEETEKHFLSVAPSAEPIAEVAFPLSGKAQKSQKPTRYYDLNTASA